MTTLTLRVTEESDGDMNIQLFLNDESSTLEELAFCDFLQAYIRDGIQEPGDE